MFACPATEDFFRARLDQMIDLRHPLAWQARRGLRPCSSIRVCTTASRRSGVRVFGPRHP